MFPNTPILHDYSVGEGLKVDFLIKTSIPVGVEIDGAQHFSYNSRWHNDRKDFQEQLRRDARKEELCEEQGIELLHYDARKGIDLHELRGSVMKAIRGSSIKAPEKPKTTTKTEWQKKMQENQKEFRKKAYQEFKKRKKESKQNSDRKGY